MKVSDNFQSGFTPIIIMITIIMIIIIIPIIMIIIIIFSLDSPQWSTQMRKRDHEARLGTNQR